MALNTHLTPRAAWHVALLILLSASPAIAADNASAAKERELIAVLESGAPADKAIACKQLAIYGGQDAVPELAKLLADEQLASWARIALEVIPGAEADDALRNATDKLEGQLLVGAIHSVGVRRDAGAVERLVNRLAEKDADVASAAALALGRIGNDAAAQALRKALPSSTGEIRDTVAEGCILCAERLMEAGKRREAAEIYDEVRESDAPKPRLLEATRGAILARETAGIPLLIEQLRSPDKGRLQFGLRTARELPGREVAEALGAELSQAAPERAVMLLSALADRADSTVSSAVLEAAKTGPTPVRIAAISIIGRAGDASHLPALLAIATGDDAELAQIAKGAIGSLSGAQVDGEIASRLSQSKGKALLVLIEAAGQRRIRDTSALVKSLDHKDAAIRRAALVALGETIGPKQLSVLIKQALSPKDSAEGEIAQQALRTACLRMPDREACAKELTTAMQAAPAASKAHLVATLGAMGGPTALESIAAVMKGNDEGLQDAGSRVLGEWMSADAAPVLLDLAQHAASDKLRVRALRGYIRLARQFEMPDDERAAMCQRAMEVAERNEEKALALAVLERYPSADTLRVAIAASETPELKNDAQRVTLAIIQKLDPASGETADLLAKIGLRPAKVEIIKAEYGAGDTQRDVTEALQRQVQNLCLIALPSSTYNESFGGDPAPGVVKKLKVHYRIDGKEGEVSFAENSVLLLPMPE